MSDGELRALQRLASSGDTGDLGAYVETLTRHGKTFDVLDPDLGIISGEATTRLATTIARLVESPVACGESHGLDCGCGLVLDLASTDVLGNVHLRFKWGDAAFWVDTEPSGLRAWFQKVGLTAPTVRHAPLRYDLLQELARLETSVGRGAAGLVLYVTRRRDVRLVEAAMARHGEGLKYSVVVTGRVRPAGLEIRA